jgi:hypothetical protein
MLFSSSSFSSFAGACRDSLLVMISLIAALFFMGCNSQTEEVAMAPVMPAPPPVPAPVESDAGISADDSGEPSNMDESGDSGESDDSGAIDDGGGEQVMTDDGSDDGSGGEEPTMTDDDGNVITAPGKSAVPPKPKTFRELADQAFSQGYDRAAVRLLQAQLLSSPGDAQEILGQYRWSSARKQPVLAVRIAVGVDLKNPNSQAGDKYAPIGSVRLPQPMRGGTRRSEESGGSDSGDSDTFETSGPASSRGFVPGNDRERVLQKYSGMMGDSLIEHIVKLHEQGNWSPFFRGNRGVLSSAPTGFASQPSENSEGEDGSSYDDGSGNMSRPSISTVSGPTPKLEGAESKYISLGPNLSFIGVTASPELISRAREGGFDALLIYDVNISLNLKLRIIYNECKARLVNLTDGKTLAASRMLKNTDAQKEIDKQGMPYVEKSMATLFKSIDEQISVTDFPTAITAEIIKSKRLPSLVADNTKSKLDRLSEIRLWREKGFLEDSDVASSFESILGAEDGRKLVGGTEEERRQVALKLLGMTSIGG